MARRLLAFPELRVSLKATSKVFMRPRRAIPVDDDLASGDAYFVAAHACVEYFFEELCRRAIYASLQEYRIRQVKSPILAELVQSFHYSQLSGLPRNEGKWTLQREAQIAAAVKWYVNRIDNNQGVKPNNLRAILFPLGFTESDFDPVWLDDMSDFGTNRGDRAHGRPLSPYHRSSVALTSVDTCTVWTKATRKPRTAVPPWDVEPVVTQLLPEMLKWDLRLAAASRPRQ